MLRGIVSIPLWLWGQALCIYPREGELIEWMLYHPLEGGKGEKVAYLIASNLFADSILQEIAYIHGVKHQIVRRGFWLCIEGQATAEGLFAFFGALRGALQRFPQRIQQGLLQTLPPKPSFSEPYSLLYEDTVEEELSPLNINRYFVRYWLEGWLRCVIRGKAPTPLVRIAQQLVSKEEEFPPSVSPMPPPPSQPLPRQGLGITYIKWKLPFRDELSFISLWVYAQRLLQYLCEDKQLTCQANWIPLPEGLELWIYTSFPIATQQIVEDFLSRPFKERKNVTASFLSWAYAPENQLLASWWACVWRLPRLPDPSSINRSSLNKVAKKWQVVSFTSALE
ncbi:MAG: hypothetical protein RMJ66_02515 [Bacteroidia bacterium]|nr:hypothetical protein [Bacteroidia bacterium]MDW8133918.1 hypothetical protein [Bacteroidia bacterium]